MPKSLWFNDSQSPGFSTEKRKADVIVVGAGLTGLLTAWRLLQEGRDVLILEARQVGSGTSGCTTGKITSQHHLVYHHLEEYSSEETARLYAEANQWGLREYFNLIKDEKIDCDLQEQTAYVYADTEDDLDMLTRENETALRIGLPSSLEDVSVSKYKALAFKGQAQFHPRKFMIALAEKIVSRGAAIAENTRVNDVQDEGVCSVKTNHGTYESDYVIYATLFPILDHSLYAVRLKPVIHHGIAYSVSKKEFDGMYIGVENISFRYFKDLLIAVGVNYHLGLHNNPYQELDQKVRSKFSIEKEQNRWSAHDQDPPDKIPFIGQYHFESARRYCATGFKAWGITHAMVAAKIITDQISGRENLWNDLYSPFRTGQALSAFMDQAKTALTHLVHDGEKRCTHMGCKLSYNEQDETFDCPCHGSRFDKDGSILWGPAVKAISHKP